MKLSRPEARPRVEDDAELDGTVSVQHHAELLADQLERYIRACDERFWAAAGGRPREAC